MFNDRLHNIVKKFPRDDRTKFAHVIDFILTLILFWALTIFALQMLPIPENMLNYFLIITLAIDTIIVYKLKKNRNKAFSSHRDIWYSAQICQENLKNINSRKEFALLIKNLLEGAAPFEKLTVHESNKNIDISGYLHKHKIGIMCLNSSQNDFKITKDQVVNFLMELNQSKINQGIIVTTGSFTDETRRFVRRMNGKLKMHLINGYGLLHMAKRSAHPIFPDEKWQEEKNTHLSGMEMAISIKENIITSKKRAILFSLLGVFFLVIAVLQAGFVGSIYLIFGVINIFIGFSGFILYYMRKNDFILP